jgi:hypothetical protein
MTNRPPTSTNIHIATSGSIERSIRLTSCDADGRRYPAPFRLRPRACTSD